MKLSKEDFLNRNNIDEESLNRSHLSWEKLLAIGTDHHSKIDTLSDTAELFVRTLQHCNSVHSVRWRVKDAEHLMEKIVRKTDPESEFYNKKYAEISIDNYYKIITDLIGIRAIHLFKEQFIDIDNFLCSNWDKYENTIVYKRDGDLDDYYQNISGDKTIKEHDAGYRSIHYIFKTKPLNREILVEIQVRTIFEEGWSEIDHNIRYPNFSDNELVSYFLKVFNRLAGSADEMGSFVKSLVSELEATAEVVNTLQAEQDSNLQQIDELLRQIESNAHQNNSNQSAIAALKSEINKLQSKPVEVCISGNSTSTISAHGVARFIRTRNSSSLTKDIVVPHKPKTK